MSKITTEQIKNSIQAQSLGSNGKIDGPSIVYGIYEMASKTECDTGIMARIFSNEVTEDDLEALAQSSNFLQGLQVIRRYANLVLNEDMDPAAAARKLFQR